MNNENGYSVTYVAERLVSATAEIMRTAKTEEDLRIGFEKALDPRMRELGVRPEPRYEQNVLRSVFRGRPDAVHGQLVIEYESPRSFRKAKAVRHAFDQTVDYLIAEAHRDKADPIASLCRMLGVGIDGEKIFFVRYSPPGVRAKAVDKDSFVLQGPHVFNVYSARTLLMNLRALTRLPLTADWLAQRFGPRSRIAPLLVSACCDALKNWQNQRVSVFYNEWKRLFGIVYGESFTKMQEIEANSLRTLYGVGADVSFQELLFSVHTFFALLIKLIAAELVQLHDNPMSSSFCDQLTHAKDEDFVRLLEDIENGGIFAKRGIQNFLEGDFLRWYLDAFSPRLKDATREMTRVLANFEMATTAIDPGSSRDLLKRLYQYLVPQEVRHRLGEYYTPDWLAELVIEETGYGGNLQHRFLDPACGSGTFLVLAIQRAREFALGQKVAPIVAVEKILRNVWGFDLNPLAVIASRTNYLFALGDLVAEMPSFEIPVYLADSVLWPEKKGQIMLGPSGDVVAVPTSLKVFFVPRIWVRGNGFLMAGAARLVEDMVKAKFSPAEALENLKSKGLVFPPHENAVEEFYKDMLSLEKEGKNGIWARFLKNSFAPMSAPKFDFVIGNPPWIRWAYLSGDYRKATLQMWKDYGLFSLKGHASRLGGGEKDFSMLFTYAASDHYLKEKGRLGFLITQEVFKSKGAGKIPSDISFEKAAQLLTKKKLLAMPIGGETGSWRTMSRTGKEIVGIQGRNAYQARLGARVEPYGVFWLEIIQVLSDGDLIVRNRVELGKRDIKSVESRIENALVYPAIRGADINRWGIKSGIFVLIVQDPIKRYGIPEEVMKKKWPRTFQYLVPFKDVLIQRASFKKYHEPEGHPFYSQYNIGEYSFSKYRVIWKRMSNDIFAAVASQAKTAFGYKTIIPTDTTAFFAVADESEAHFLCAIINSESVRDFIKSYSSAGRGFGTPSVMNHIAIPKYDPNDPVHARLSSLSKKLHELKARGTETGIVDLEKEVNGYIGQLFSSKSRA
jgi:hypothetical protein